MRGRPHNLISEDFPTSYVNLAGSTGSHQAVLDTGAAEYVALKSFWKTPGSRETNSRHSWVSLLRKRGCWWILKLCIWPFFLHFNEGGQNWSAHHGDAVLQSSRVRNMIRSCDHQAQNHWWERRAVFPTLSAPSSVCLSPKTKATAASRKGDRKDEEKDNKMVSKKRDLLCGPDWGRGVLQP